MQYGLKVKIILNRYIYRKCKYKLRQNCNYELDEGDKNCNTVFNSSYYGNMVQELKKNEHCFQTNVPQGKIRLKVDFYNCNNFTHHTDKEIRNICSLRSVKCDINENKLKENVNSIFNGESDNLTNTLYANLNISFQYLQTKLEQWIKISSNETLNDVLNISDGNKSFIEKICTKRTKLNLDENCESYFNTSADDLLNCLNNASLEEKFIRGKKWLNGIVAKFRLYVNLKNKTLPSNTFFTLFIAKSVNEMDEKTKNEWFELEANRAKQEPSMGLHFHLNATDRLKKDQIYCRMGRLDLTNAGVFLI